MKELGRKTINSSFLMVLLRVFQRSIGLISTLILARVLIPEDFGIVAIVTIIGLFFNILTNTGSEQYIIQKKIVNRSDLNTAFTLDIITKIIIWFAFYLSIPFIANFYDKQELLLPLQVSSLILIIGAGLNPKIYLLKRQLKFKPFAKIEAFRKIFSFAIVMTILIFEQSYWAIIFGDLASIAFAVTGSYIIAPFKPLLSCKNINAQWLFSKWMLLKGIFGFIRSQIDTILASKLFQLDDLGRYHMAKHIAYIPANDIIIPISEPILSALSASKRDALQLQYRCTTTIIATTFLALPLTVFVYCKPDILTYILLGDKWQDANALLGLLGISMGITCLNRILETSMLAIAKVKQMFIYDIFTTITLGLVLLIANHSSIYDFTQLMTILLCLFSLALTIICRFYIKFSLIRIVKLSIPAIIASLFSIQLVSLINFDSGNQSIILGIGIGAFYITTYCLIMFLVLRLNTFYSQNEIKSICQQVSRIVPKFR